jgi:hypothetical protein
MATKQKNRGKRPAKKPNGKPSSSGSTNRRVERELKMLREENRQLKRTLGALICKDDPVNMDLVPEDGTASPTLAELIRDLERSGKKHADKR